MKYPLSLIGYVACVGVLWSQPVSARPAAQPVLQSAESDDAAVLAAARTIVVIGLTGTTTMTDRHRARPDGARAELNVEAVLRDWGRYEVVEDPGLADLVVLVIERQKTQTPFQPAMLVAELKAYRRGRMITTETPALWSGEAAEGFRKLPATRVAEKFRDFIIRLPQPAT